MLDDYQSLVRKIDEVKKTIIEKKGVSKQIKKRIKSDFGCSTIKAAKKKVASLLREENKLAAKYTKKKEVFESKWAKKLKKIK